jgi:hypothetical protein
MDLPAALTCEIDVGVVAEVTPVAVGVGARKDGLAIGESVLRFVLVMTQSSPMVQPGVPAAGVEGDCQNSGFKARNYVDLYCESDWDYVNDDSRRRDTACVRAV